MKWEKLSDGRTCLPAGTILLLDEEGGCYRITGPPIGFGGSGIIYPAVRLRREGDDWKEEEMNLAVKECFPSVPGKVLERNDTGRIIGREDRIYQFALEQMRNEKTVTGIIYNEGFRLVPVWTSREKEQISLDGRVFAEADNYYAVMERVDEKGLSLEELACHEKLTAKEIVSLMCQLLRALREVHKSGFIHGDIQTGNIFVKGYEAGDDLGMVSLLDFGAARKLGPDNRTEPIRDRALYTTKGFTAPECITKNDGTLRLSPAADLYSAGCVFLRMLSGRLIRRQAVELVTNGIYIYPRQAIKLKCPDSAAAAINRVLDRALKKDPAERYQTAEEMLRDLVRIGQSLAPVNLPVAAYEYAAFISYCHSEKTKPAAHLLADAIEHYRIPGYAGRITGADGKKRRTPGRVFLDRLELSGGGDMGEQITGALEQSAFLIVILGGGSENSRWVAREIEVFLRTHTRDRILTVLAEGSEKDSMPEILRTQEFLTGEGKEKKPVESLSADLRADSLRSLKKALKTEKLRLIAPMLGCSFDDLKQREKEARTRRIIRGLSAGMAGLAAVAGIIGFQASQIKSRNIRLQRLHAQELAEESARYLNRGERETALRLALEALSGYSDDREPAEYTEARAALQNALYLYRDADSLTMAKKALHTMKMGSRAAAGMEELSPDGLRMLTRGTDGSVYVWDLQTGDLLAGPDETHDSELNQGVLFAGFLDNSRLLLIKDGKAMHYTFSASEEEEDGEKENSVTETFSFDSGSFGMGTSGKEILFGSFDKERTRIALCAAPESEITESGVRHVVPELRVYDTGTLELLGSVSCFDDPEASGFGNYNSLSASGPVLSQNGQWAALPLTDLFKGDNTDSGNPAGAMLLLNLEEQSRRVITDQDSGFLSARFSDEDALITFGYAPVTLWELQEMPLRGAAFCIETGNGMIKWRSPVEGQTRMGEDSLGILLRKDRAVLWGNRQIQVLDLYDGSLLRTIQIRNGIAGVFDSPEDGSGGNSVLVSDRRGRLAVVDFEKGILSEVGTSIDRPVDHFWYTMGLNDGAMVVSDESEGTYILLGASENRADQVISLNTEIGEYRTGQDSAFMLVEREKGTGVLTALDLRSGEWKGSYPADAVYRFSEADQVFQIRENEDGSRTTRLLDLSEDEVLSDKTDVSIPVVSSKNGFAVSGPDDRVLYSVSGDGVLRSLDPETGTEKARSAETYTKVYSLSADNERGMILLDAIAEEDERVQGVNGPGASHVLWIYEETAEGKLCRMAGADNGIYSSVAGRIAEVFPETGKIYLYDCYGAEDTGELIILGQGDVSF